jgi:hypothetical protein
MLGFLLQITYFILIYKFCVVMIQVVSVKRMRNTFLFNDNAVRRRYISKVLVIIL